MRELNLTEIRNSSVLLSIRGVVRIHDDRKKKSVGFFIPSVLSEEFDFFFQKVQKRKKTELLKRVARAQAKDPIE